MTQLTLHTVKETAEILKLSTSKVYDLLATGEIKTQVELGDTRSKLRVRSDAIREYIDRHTIETGSIK